jgi:hypothetical protein
MVANLEKGSNYAKSNMLDVTESIEMQVKIMSDQGSEGPLRCDVELLHSFTIPGREEPMYRPEAIKSGFVSPGEEKQVTLNVEPGKYRLSLHSDEGNCKGSASVS